MPSMTLQELDIVVFDYNLIDHREQEPRRDFIWDNNATKETILDWIGTTHPGCEFEIDEVHR